MDFESLREAGRRVLAREPHPDRRFGSVSVAATPKENGRIDENPLLLPRKGQILQLQRVPPLEDRRPVTSPDRRLRPGLR
eukprot:CAMPEP_0174892512 /NCGR_PEP_ID=MMETSP0167-20121228/7452_1 /TAXON_ID=38298 /ORGANISM="Rhodella maculata, Strain CCMP736" /LENGTH=79 /DNA_ID=CAMNT_0016131025 /DNA_START=270 /DNA_END=505 /DNA_ORIENTATION=+